MMLRRALVTGGLLVGLALLVWLLRGDRHAPEVVAPVVGAAAAPASAPTELAAAPQRPGSDFGSGSGSPRAPLAPAAAPPFDSAENPPVARDVFALRGHVDGRDPDGVALPPFDGLLELRVWRGRRGTPLEVEVADGAFATEIEEPESVTHLTVAEVATNGVALAIEAPLGEMPLPADGELAVRARMPRAVVLHVVDAADGRALDGVELVAGPPYPGRLPPHPGLDVEGARVGKGLASPIRLERQVPPASRDARATLWVRAPDHAWASVRLDWERGGERTLALEPGGALTLGLVGVEPDAAAMLYLHAPPERLHFETVAREGELTVEGLPAGPARASVEIPRFPADPRVLGETEVEIVAGARAHATLVLDAAPAEATATVSGTLLVPAAWEARDPRLTMRALDGGTGGSRVVRPEPAASARPGIEAFAWSASEVSLGRHEVGLYRPPFSIVVDVPAGGLSDVVLEVPPPAELAVRLVDARSGQDVETARLMWHPRRPKGVQGGGLHRARRDPDSGLHHLRAPATAIVLVPMDGRYWTTETEVDLATDVNELELRLEPGCALVVVLRDGETRIAFPDGLFGFPKAAEGTDAVLSRATPGELEHRFQLSGPGTFTLEPPQVPGYRAVPTQTIEIAPGEVKTHVIELEREHR